MSDDDKIVPITRGVKPGEIIAVVGGTVDESKVTLAIYGEDLEPPHVTEALGVVPTSAHRKGERRGPRSPPYQRGAWFLEEAGESPIGPEELITRLLARVPNSGAPVWAQLRERFEVELRFGLFMVGWNQGFGINNEQINALAAMGCRLEFDLYADDGDDE